MEKSPLPEIQPSPHRLPQQQPPLFTDRILIGKHNNKHHHQIWYLRQRCHHLRIRRKIPLQTATITVIFILLLIGVLSLSDTSSVAVTGDITVTGDAIFILLLIYVGHYCYFFIWQRLITSWFSIFVRTYTRLDLIFVLALSCVDKWR